MLPPPAGAEFVPRMRKDDTRQGYAFPAPPGRGPVGGWTGFLTLATAGSLTATSRTRQPRKLYAEPSRPKGPTLARWGPSRTIHHSRQGGVTCSTFPPAMGLRPQMAMAPSRKPSLTGMTTSNIQDVGHTDEVEGPDAGHQEEYPGREQGAEEGLDHYGLWNGRPSSRRRRSPTATAGLQARATRSPRAANLLVRRAHQPQPRGTGRGGRWLGFKPGAGALPRDAGPPWLLGNKPGARGGADAARLATRLGGHAASRPGRGPAR